MWWGGGTALQFFQSRRDVPAVYPLERELIPVLRKVGYTQSQAERSLKFSPPPEFDSQNFQPVASRYIHYAIPAKKF
jgi:hypothetical protein